MMYYAGIDVSLECSSVCVMDATGKMVREAKVASEPEALIVWFGTLGLTLERIGLEAGPLSQWLYAAMRRAGLSVELLETRHVRDAFKAMPVKSDRNDARGIAQLMRFGWFRPVHCKSMAAQEVRALLTARKLVQAKLHDVEMSLRGILRGFGLKVGRTTPTRFVGRITELVSGHTTLEVVATALLAAHEVLRREFQGFERRVRLMARQDARVRLLMSAPGVGTIVALTYVSAIDDPTRFKSSKGVGAHFGLTPKKHQSGEKDITGRISKLGDGSVRAALYEAGRSRRRVADEAARPLENDRLPCRPVVGPPRQQWSVDWRALDNGLLTPHRHIHRLICSGRRCLVRGLARRQTEQQRCKVCHTSHEQILFNSNRTRNPFSM
jgi:transposase